MDHLIVDPGLMENLIILWSVTINPNARGWILIWRCLTILCYRNEKYVSYGGFNFQSMARDKVCLMPIYVCTKEGEGERICVCVCVRLWFASNYSAFYSTLSFISSVLSVSKQFAAIFLNSSPTGAWYDVVLDNSILSKFKLNLICKFISPI